MNKLKSDFRLAGYALGMLSSANISENMLGLAHCDFDTIILGMFHFTANGDIHFNNEPLIVDGAFQGTQQWLDQLKDVASSGSVKRMIASFGGGGTEDFTNINEIYLPPVGFDGTRLEKNLVTFQEKFRPFISIIDLDNEDCIEPASFLSFCKLLGDLHFGLTFCPYTNQSFWVECLASLQASNPGLVRWWNLQCYADIDGYQDPKTWAAAIRARLPKFDTDNFIYAGGKAVTPEGGHSISIVPNTLVDYKNEKCIGGAFLWNMDIVLNAKGNLPITAHRLIAALQ